MKETDAFAELILKERDMQKSQGTFEPWDFEERYNASRYRRIGYLDLADAPAFRTHKDALECFGYTGGHYQRATWKLRDGSNRMVWFPKLYENRDWDNSLTEDGLTITMTPKTDWAYNRLDGDDDDASNGVGMIVFAHSKDALGSTLYRFMGTFRRSEFREQDCTWIFKRESGRVDLPA